MEVTYTSKLLSIIFLSSMMGLFQGAYQIFRETISQMEDDLQYLKKENREDKKRMETEMQVMIEKMNQNDLVNEVTITRIHEIELKYGMEVRKNNELKEKLQKEIEKSCGKEGIGLKKNISQMEQMYTNKMSDKTELKKIKKQLEICEKNCDEMEINYFNLVKDYEAKDKFIFELGEKEYIERTRNQQLLLGNKQLVEEINKLKKYLNLQLDYQDKSTSELENKMETLQQKQNTEIKCKEIFSYHDIQIPIDDEREIFPYLKKLRKLGEGGFAEVDLVEFCGERCVKKNALRDQVQVHELQIMSYLNGAGGAPILHATTTKFSIFSVVGNITFWDAILHRDVPQDMLFEGLLQTSIKLSEIHCMGISHNDIKADNIMINSETKQVSIIDFGMSCEMGEMYDAIEDQDEFQRRDWVAPEVKQGHPVTPAGDIYSLGVLLGLILGFEKKIKQAVLALAGKVLSCDPEEILSLDYQAVLALAGKALSCDPEERPSLDEFITVLGYVCQSDEMVNYRNNAFIIIQEVMD